MPVRVPVPVVGKVQTGNVLRYVGVPEEEEEEEDRRQSGFGPRGPLPERRGKRELEGIKVRTKEGESPRAAPWPLRWLERGLID